MPVHDNRSMARLMRFDWGAGSALIEQYLAHPSPPALVRS